MKKKVKHGKFTYPMPSLQQCIMGSLSHFKRSQHLFRLFRFTRDAGHAMLPSFVSFYCYHAIVVNSLQVAIMKYIFIVHSFKARRYGEKKVQKTFFWLNITIPLILAIIALLTTNFQTRSALKSCFGEVAHPSLMPNHSQSGNMNFIICTNLNQPDYGPVLYFILQCFCISRKIMNWIMVSNIPEAYFYYKIFSAMQR